MNPLYYFTEPTFTARSVAEAIGKDLGQQVTYQEAEDDCEDGNVDVSSRVHVQVGADYLVVGAWVDATTLKSWPPRKDIASACNDVRAARIMFPAEAA